VFLLHPIAHSLEQLLNQVRAIRTLEQALVCVLFACMAGQQTWLYSLPALKILCLLPAHYTLPLVHHRICGTFIESEPIPIQNKYEMRYPFPSRFDTENERGKRKVMASLAVTCCRPAVCCHVLYRFLYGQLT
jgi:hypothetical protein